MKMHVQGAHIFALPKIKEDRANDIIVSLDKAGFITDISHNAARLGIDLKAQLLMPHIADFTIAQYQQKVARYLVDVLAGKPGEQGVEFPVPPILDHDHDNDRALDYRVESEESHEWFVLTLSYDGRESNSDAGPIGTMRSIGHKRANAPATTGKTADTARANSDPFTGLADRRSFTRDLMGNIAMDETASVALFAIDGMRAIFMQYGQSTADEIRWGFARFLEAMVDPDHNLAQVDEERFGVILPAVAPREAREWAADVLGTFSALTQSPKGNAPRLSASAGIARIEMSAEWTIRQAELGLVMARAAGGMQTAICRPQSNLANGRSIEAAIETLVERTVRGKT